MSILIIRHGETALNAARVVQVPETPLSERGLEQAQRLGARLKGFSIGRIVTSDYTRAHMTAKAVHEHTGVALEIETLLRERNFGAVRGTPYSELDFDILDPNFKPPAGESLPVFDERVTKAWAAVTAIATTMSEDLAVVTHGLVCKSLAKYHLAESPTIADGELGFANTSVTIVEAEAPWKVTRFACIEHLGETNTGGAPV